MAALKIRTYGDPCLKDKSTPVESVNGDLERLIHDMGEPNSFLLLTVDSSIEPPMLDATYMGADGTVLYHLRLSASDLEPDS